MDAYLDDFLELPGWPGLPERERGFGFVDTSVDALLESMEDLLPEPKLAPDWDAALRLEVS